MEKRKRRTGGRPGGRRRNLLILELLLLLLASFAWQRLHAEHAGEGRTELSEEAEYTLSSLSAGDSGQTGETEGPLSSERRSAAALPQREEDAGSFRYEELPAYAGLPFAEVNGGLPYFAQEDLLPSSYEHYSPLDSLGRCGPAMANVGRDLMPDEPRGPIGMIKPTGWHTVRYDDLIGDRYLYNRCHLLAYQLTGENANPQNLITGTRYMNVEGMLPYERRISDYVKSSGRHVLFRVTPVFLGEELVARGVLMEAYSSEDEGEGVCFNAFVYNVQPGIIIDYATGDSRRAEG